jgi:hypothetical protein
MGRYVAATYFRMTAAMLVTAVFAPMLGVGIAP